MSVECGECERDLRGGHDPSCSRYRPQPREASMAMPERVYLRSGKDGPYVEYLRHGGQALVGDALTPAYLLGFERGKEAAATTHQRTLEALRAVEPYLDAITCYASTIDEHEGNRVAALVQAALAKIKEAT